MKTFPYHGSTDALRQLPDLVGRGVRIVCPQCGADLIVALNWETANKHKVHTGIYCPADPQHVCELIELQNER